MVGAVLIAAVGDVLIDRPDPVEALRWVRPVLTAADLVVGNFEGVLSDANTSGPGLPISTIVPTGMAKGLDGFDILSLANNHALDAGYGGLADSLATLRAHGLTPVGAGRTAREAWTPEFVERHGTRIAVIAISTVLRAGWEATGEAGGIAALRSVDHWTPRFRGIYSPGIPPMVSTVANEGDWSRLASVVRDARASADLVLVSVHWGDHTRPWTVTAFERDIAARLTALGVDAVLGHHQHYLRGAEFLGSTVVCFGLGHLVFDSPRLEADLAALGIDLSDVSEAELAARYGDYAIYPRAVSPTFPFHSLARWSVIALLGLAPGRPPTAGLVPLYLDAGGTPRPVDRDDYQWAAAVEVLRQCAVDGPVAFDVTDSGRTVGGAGVLDIVPGETTTRGDRGGRG